MLEGAGAWCGGSMTLSEGASTMGREGGHAHPRPPIDGLSGQDLSSVLYFVLFPNALVSLHPDYVMLHTLWPRAVDRTDVVCEWLFEPATIAADGFDPSDAIDFWDQVNREDWHVCELTQLGVRNRGAVAGRYSAEEDDVHAFDVMVAEPLHGGASRARGGAGVNEIAAKLGEVGLPEPVAELAKRDWDAIVVGGGHNGLTAAAYLARAGRSVCVLERRERLGGACTLERPFSDERFVVSPCAYVVGLLDDLVIRELELERRGLRYWMADPNLWVPFDDGTAFGQWLDHSRTQANLEELGVSAADIEGYWAYEELFDEVRRKLRQGERDTWVGEAPTRAEIEELLDSDRTMIDLVFEASIADVLDDHLSDERLKTALFGQGIIGTWGGPKDPGTASIKLMHFQGDMDGQGPLWGYVEGGMGMVSFAIADAAREAGAVLACGVPVAEIVPGEGVTLEDGSLAAGGHRDLERRPEANARHARWPGDRPRLPRAAGALEGPQPGGQVQRGARAAAELERRAGRSVAGAGDDRRHRARSRRRSAPSRPASAASRPSPSARSTSRPATTPAPPPRAST